MSGCCRPSCPSNEIYHYDSDDDECAGDRGHAWNYPFMQKARSKSSSGSDVMNVFVDQGAHVEPCQSCPYHSVCRPSVDCPGCPDSWQQTILKAIDVMRNFCKNFCKDPYTWEIIKSSLWFTVGLRLFRIINTQSDIFFKKPVCFKRNLSKNAN